MQAIKKVLLLTCILLSCRSAEADSNPPGYTPDPAHTTIMPAIDISNQPLEKVLDQTRSKLAWFHYVVFRTPGTSVDYPKLPSMSIEGVTVEQFLRLIKYQYSDISIETIPGDKQPLYSIKIDDSAKQGRKEAAIKVEYSKAALENRQTELKRKQTLQRAGTASQSEVDQAELDVHLAQSQLGLAMLEAKRNAATDNELGADPKSVSIPPIVKVFRLDEIIADSKSGADPKKATDDILSLIQAAMDAAGGDSKDQLVLKVHPPTRTLIFKGQPEQEKLLSQVLETLQPKKSEDIFSLEAKLNEAQHAFAEQSLKNNQLMDELRAAHDAELEFIDQLLKEAKSTRGPDDPVVKHYEQLRSSLTLKTSDQKPSTTQRSE